MRLSLQLPALCLACSIWLPAGAQEPESRTSSQAEAPVRVVPAENVRFDYAQVLRVEPIYQTLRATRTEERCDDVPVVEVRSQVSGGGKAGQPSGGVLSRMLDSVKGMFRDEPEAKAPPEPAPASATPRGGSNCRLVQVERQFQRPIAYDVDYVYKGTKYRSRLGEDPGNRLRIRVSVTPWVGEGTRTP
ncbi:hypothetical protein Psesu_1223 [Pseudoxanthomonas suwonensis 11-1]|uniref:Secreted protein n=1 Tax=Pseudoxanthomonas suwonensis (strain 11-1) TaxID=743721 RepID=E6WSC2_PSEUU|nr:hypothetical protein [Pseudoxanthomonas suwonensis]ADV27071.1 hypothetical protein Psesu_1223 [Pseudoxanthomonas suwonensis 11-1]